MTTIDKPDDMSSDPAVLRQEINAIIDKVEDRGTLLYFHWLLKRISNNDKLPPIEELKTLHGAFVRLAYGFRNNKKIKAADLQLVFKHVGQGSGMEISRSLGMAVRLYREQKKITRLQLSKRSRFPLRLLIAIERGQIKDMSLNRMNRLANGLGIDAVILMDKIMELEKDKG